jgi:ketosteroid isomerase-like protein
MKLMHVLPLNQGNLLKVQKLYAKAYVVSFDLNGKLDLKIKRVLQSSDLALVISEWSVSGTGPDGKPVNMAAKSADVLRQQADGTWRFAIDNPWGTD